MKALSINVKIEMMPRKFRERAAWMDWLIETYSPWQSLAKDREPIL